MSMTTELIRNLRDYAEIEDKNFLMGYQKSNIVQNLLREAADTIENSCNGGWIPVKEKLPESESCEVLCQDTYGQMLIGYIYEDEVSFDTGFSVESDECIMHNCIAWQPLPPVYEPKED